MTATAARLPASFQLAADALAGRVVLVTGATGGLGGATAMACARAGATVILCGRKVRALEKVYDEVAAVGPQPAIVPVNLAGADAGDYDKVRDLVGEQLGRLDGVVHAAAHFDALTPLAMHSPEGWTMALKVNLEAPFLLTRALWPLLLESPDPALVFVLDDPGRMGRAHWGGYGVSKAGLAGLVRILADETETSRIRVHALLPGPMRTGLRRKAWFGEQPDEVPTPEHAAQAAAWLLGADASGLRGRELDLRQAPPGAP